MSELIRQIGISELTFYSWRTSRKGAGEAWCGGMRAERLKELK
ncbi:MAG: hypothetical protein AAF416_20965 [Pseudomonadota bacterium]